MIFRKQASIRLRVDLFNETIECLCRSAPGVTLGLAKQTASSVSVLGSLQTSKIIENALGACITQDPRII